MVDWRRYVEAIMEECVMTQEQFGNALGLTQQAVSNWKTGARTPPAQKQSLMRKSFSAVNPDDFPLDPCHIARHERKKDFRAMPSDVRAFCKRMKGHSRRTVEILFEEVGPLLVVEEERYLKAKELRKRVHAKREEKRATKIN